MGKTKSRWVLRDSSSFRSSFGQLAKHSGNGMRDGGSARFDLDATYSIHGAVAMEAAVSQKVCIICTSCR